MTFKEVKTYKRLLKLKKSSRIIYQASNKIKKQLRELNPPNSSPQ